jgi:hypothetical protein
MSNLTDARFNALRGEGYTGSVNSMLLQWLHIGGATSPALPDAWAQWLDIKLVDSGAFNERWSAYLGSQGHTGALNDRELQFWTAE